MTPTSASCVGAWAIELVWWSLATRCVQWRIQIFAVSSRWSCSNAQTSSRGSTRWGVLPRVQAGGDGVTIWGVFQSRGKSQLQILDGNMDRYQYISVLETKMLPFDRRDFPAKFEFQDDNGPIHRAWQVMDFREDENVQYMDWPATSPDLKPIDNPTTNMAELTQAVMDIWRDIPDHKLSIFVLSIPWRLRTLYNARRGHTKYWIVFDIAWHDSLALTQRQIFWIWISVVLWRFISTNTNFF